MTGTFELDGEEAMLAKIQRLYPLYSDAAKQGMADWADDVMAVSKREYVPVDTGALKASGYVGEVQDTGEGLSLELGYSENYAAPVHERPARHEVGTDHYLETPLILKSGELLPRVAKMMERAAEEQL